MVCYEFRQALILRRILDHDDLHCQIFTILTLMGKRQGEKTVNCGPNVWINKLCVCVCLDSWAPWAAHWGTAPCVDLTCSPFTVVQNTTTKKYSWLPSFLSKNKGEYHQSSQFTYVILTPYVTLVFQSRVSVIISNEVNLNPTSIYTFEQYLEKATVCCCT